MTGITTPGPDQAIGWVVAWACFFINFITAGIARSSGVLFVALINDYGVTRGEATSPFSLRISVRSMSGPFVGLLGQRYGYRGMIVIGGFVAALGSILCAFAPSIPWLTFFWGIIHGIGFGLSTVLHMMVVGEYFDKYKASALGFAYSGDCFGTFAFPVIIEHLLDSYSVDGMFLIIGGIVLNVVPMGMLLNSPPWKKSEKIQKKILNTVITESNTQNANNELQCKGEVNEGFITSDEFLHEHRQCNASKSIDETSNSILISGSVEFSKSDELSNPRCRARSIIKPHPSEIKNPTTANTEDETSGINTMNNSCKIVSNTSCIEEQNTKQCDLFCGEANGLPHENTIEQSSDNQADVSADNIKTRRTTSFTFDLAEKIRTASFASLVAQEGFIILADCGKERRNEDITSDSLKGSNCNHLGEISASKDSNNPIIKKSSILLKEENRLTNEKSLLKILIRTNLRPLFFLISFSMAAFVYLLVGVLTAIIDYAIDQNISMDMSKYLIVAYSLTDLIGRLSCGIIIDKKLVKMKTYAFLMLLISSLSVGVLPLNNSFYYMIICISIFGFFQGGTAIMFPILITTYMEKDEESIAMGCLNFYSGVLMLGMGRMIGFFRDNIGAYDGVFYILGILGFAIGCLWLIEPLLLKFEEKYLKKQRHGSTTTNF